LRSPPRLREDATGLQRRAGLTASGHRCWPIKTPGLGHRPDSAGSQKVAIPVRLGRNKNLPSDLGTLEQHRQEVKSMKKMNPEERRRAVP
jgi:hypothetical protein